MAGSGQSHGGGWVRVWSSAADAPRLRRPTDALLLVTSVLTLGLLALAAPGPTGADDALDMVLARLEPVFGWLWSIVYAVLTLWAVGVIALTAQPEDEAENQQQQRQTERHRDP